MKVKLFSTSLIFSSLLLGGCTQDVLFTEHTNDVDNVNKSASFKIPSDVAIEQAMGFISDLNPATRGEKRSVKEITLIGNDSKTRSGEEGDSLLYLINFADDKGFVLMSADVRSIPIYAISDTGNFIINEENEEQMTGIIEGAKQNVLAASLDTVPVGPGVQIKPWWLMNGWESVPINYRIAPKLSEFQSRVSEYGGFSKYCRNGKGEPAMSGCVAIATEQLLSYYQHPTYIDNYYISWENANSSAGLNTVARVLQLIGSPKYLDLDYQDENNIAPGNHEDVPPTLTKLGYQHCGRFIGFFANEQVAVDALDEGPILVRAKSTKFGDAGHLWVIDGMIQYKVNTNHYISTPPVYIYPNLFHCVWGFPDGSSNGYYYADLYGFIGEPCFKDSTDPTSNECSQYASCDKKVVFLYGFKPIRSQE